MIIAHEKNSWTFGAMLKQYMGTCVFVTTYGGYAQFTYIWI